MMDDEMQVPGVDEPPPAASLTGIPLRRPTDKPSAQPHKTAGDITTALADTQQDPGPELRHLPDGAAERLESFARGEAPTAPREPPPPAAEISAYWRELKQGRRFPARSDLDPAHIASHWPNAMLLVCEPGAPQPRPDTGFSATLRASRQQTLPGEADYIDYTTMIVEWVLSVGRAAARTGRPVQDRRPFPSPRGEVRYRVLALPLSEDRTTVDHVLCNVTHAP